MASKNSARPQPVVFNMVPVEQQLVAAEPRFRALATATARGIDYHIEHSFALSLVRESESLQKCDPVSFGEAFENLGAMGLSLNKNLGQAALIPRWNNKLKKMWVTAQPMYRGYIALATGGPSIKNVWGAVVLEDDVFELEQGSAPKIRHVPKIVRGADKASRVPSPKNVLGAYVCAEVAGSAHVHITWMDIDDILKIAERSESYNPKERKGRDGGDAYTPKPSGPWITDFGQMCIKTVFRRGFKTWPGIDAKEYTPLQNAVRVDTDAEIMEQAVRQEKEPAPEGGVLVITEAQAKELTELALAKKCRPETVFKAYAIESFTALPADKFPEVKARIESFGKRK